MDDGTTVTDFDEEEIARKHTLSASLAYAEWNKHKINVIDTPGIGNFLSEARAALTVADAALVVVDAVSVIVAVFGIVEIIAIIVVIFEAVQTISVRVVVGIVVVARRLGRRPACPPPRRTGRGCCRASG